MDCKAAGLIRDDYDPTKSVAYSRYPDQIFRIAAAKAVQMGIFRNIVILCAISRALNDPEMYQI